MRIARRTCWALASWAALVVAHGGVASRSPGAGGLPPADTNVYLVWSIQPRGVETVWLVPDGGGSTVEATRRQAMIFADDTLFGLDWERIAFREVSCQEHERDRDVGGEQRLGPRRQLPYLVARGLAGKRGGQTEALSEPRSAYFGPEQGSGATAVLVGEHWGRTQSVVGSWRDAVLVVDCEGAYGCGAHGTRDCSFALEALGPEVPSPDTGSIAEALADDAKAMLAEWVGEGEAIRPGLDHYKLVADDGKILIEYVYIASVPYSASDGSWSSYTQSRTHRAKPVGGTGLGEAPPRIERYLADAHVSGHFGWSVVKPEQIEQARKAFLDQATLPSPN
ncbi:MAG: hypothetical protein KJ067_07360 [Vicinamibacteria bacterium]|nr:hypothetical protein [Vicinamibacteria bacterium]